MMTIKTEEIVSLDLNPELGIEIEVSKSTVWINVDGFRRLRASRTIGRLPVPITVTTPDGSVYSGKLG